MLKTLTRDQGREMARWADIEKALGIEAYANPAHPGKDRPTSQPTAYSADGCQKAPTSTSANPASRVHNLYGFYN